MTFELLGTAWSEILSGGELTGHVLTLFGLVILAATAITNGVVAFYNWFKGHNQTASHPTVRFLFGLIGWISAIAGVALVSQDLELEGLITLCLTLGVAWALILLLCVWASDPKGPLRRWLPSRWGRARKWSWRQWLPAWWGDDPDLTGIMCEVPAPPIDRTLSPAESTRKAEQLLKSLDIPVKRNGTHLRIGAPADTEQAMAQHLIALMKARFPRSEVLHRPSLH
jgi:hypothetical protein